MGKHGVDAANQLDLLLEGELGEHGLGLGLDSRRVRHGRLGHGRKGCGESADDQQRKNTGESEGKRRFWGALQCVFHIAKRLAHRTAPCIEAAGTQEISGFSPGKHPTYSTP